MPEWDDATAVKVAYRIIKAQERLLVAYRTGRTPGAAIDYLNANKERFLAYAERSQLREGGE